MLLDRAVLTQKNTFLFPFEHIPCPVPGTQLSHVQEVQAHQRCEADGAQPPACEGSIWSERWSHFCPSTTVCGITSLSVFDPCSG